MKYIQFQFATGRMIVVPFMKGTKKEINNYIEKFKNVDGGICRYEKVNKEDAFMFDSYNRVYG